MKYYIVENGNATGPFEVAELIDRGIKGSDLVWTEGFADWVTAGNVEEISVAIRESRGASMPEMPGQCPPPYPQQGGCPTGNCQPPVYSQVGYQQSNNYAGQPNYGQPPYQQAPGWQQPAPYEMPPKSWLVESILLTLCCCLPIGIYCIVKASSVNSLWNCGRYDEAREASEKAKKWLIIGLIVGVILNILSVIVNLAFTSSLSDLYNI